MLQESRWRMIGSCSQKKGIRWLLGLENLVVWTGCQLDSHREFTIGEERVHASMPRLLGSE